MTRETKYYRGQRERVGVRVWSERVKDGSLVPGSVRELPTKNDVHDHSPDGFEWGYGGSGPSQLALAIACDLLDDDAAGLERYRDLMSMVVSLPDVWTLSEMELLEALR